MWINDLAIQESSKNFRIELRTRGSGVRISPGAPITLENRGFSTQPPGVFFRNKTGAGVLRDGSLHTFSAATIRFSSSARE